MTPSNAVVSMRSAFAPGAASQKPGASADRARQIDLEVTLLHNANDPSSGQVVLHLPDGWRAKPASQAFAFSRAGERVSYRFAVTPGPIGPQTYEIEAAAIDGLGEYRDGYELIDHRDLELRYLYRESTTVVRGVDVTTVAGVKVGYVMGIGDQVPQGLQQLGAQVTLLGERELASANLSAYDTIMIGTRAYAVREDLKTYNSRLLDYVRAGGNMIVLYNTQEFVPNTFAPFPGELPRTAEEVSEEDSPVTILAPTHQAFNWPNRITAADFQRLGRAARLEVLDEVGRVVYADDRDEGSRTGAAERWMVDGESGQRHLDLLRLCLTSSIALRGCGRVSDCGESAGVE